MSKMTGFAAHNKIRVIYSNCKKYLIFGERQQVWRIEKKVKVEEEFKYVHKGRSKFTSEYWEWVKVCDCNSESEAIEMAYNLRKGN